MIRIEAIPVLAAKLAAELKSSGGKHSARIAKKIRAKRILTPTIGNRVAGSPRAQSPISV